MRVLLSLVFAVSLSAQTPYVVKELAEGPASISVARTIAADDWVYFNVYGVPARRFYSLWRTDGTAEGTVKLSDDDYLDGNTSTLALGRTLFFRMAHDHSSLWRTDGTPEGTTPVAKIVDGFAPQFGFVLGDRMLLSVSNELWSASLTPGRPPLRLGTPDGYGFVKHAGRAYYFTDAHSRRHLWSTDGTPEGTYFVNTIDEYSDTGPIVMGGHIYFTTLGGTKLWRSEGTSDGTYLVTRIATGVVRLVPAETKLFMIDRNGRLWVTDGTAAGTLELPANPLDGTLTRLGDKVVFRHGGPAGSTDLWTSDGTPEGTYAFHELDTFPPHVRAGTLVYFKARNIDTGTELWATDGSAAGTKLVADAWPGFPSGNPENLQFAGERLFFTAWTPATGRELWAVPLPPAPRVSIEDVRAAEAPATARFTVSLSSAAAQAVTVSFTTTDGTATAGSDYEPASGTVTFAPGETSRTIDVHVLPDDVLENNETFLVRLRSASGAEIETGTAAAIIEDDDRTADVGLAFDFSKLDWYRGGVDITNAGPHTATNFRIHTTGTPPSSRGTTWDECVRCTTTLAPGARQQELQFGIVGAQEYRTASVRVRERDPGSSNNTLAWTTKDQMLMEALHLAPGSEAKVWLGSHWTGAAGVANVESSDPSVLAVPATVALPAGRPASFMARGLAPGTATIRVVTSHNTTHRLTVDVLAPGTSRRWPGAFRSSASISPREFQTPLEVYFLDPGSAPFTGARATGPVTLTANGVEVGRVFLGLHPSPIVVHLPDVGDNLLTIHYGGDENFLPQVETWTVPRTRGRATVHATAVRHGSRVVVDAYITGSRWASPGGTIRVGTAEIPLTHIGPGMAHGELTLTDVPEATTTITLAYSGDTRYYEFPTEIRIQRPGRRRAVD